MASSPPGSIGVCISIWHGTVGHASVRQDTQKEPIDQGEFAFWRLRQKKGSLPVSIIIVLDKEQSSSPWDEAPAYELYMASAGYNIDQIDVTDPRCIIRFYDNRWVLEWRDFI